MRLMRAAMRAGRHPMVRKQASGMVICKPGRDNYRSLKAYRSMSLLSCMGKVVEKVATELLSEQGKSRGRLRHGQFRSRIGHSAIDAEAIMVDRAHAAQTNGHIIAVLHMDIKEAFPSVAKGRLVNLTKVSQMVGDRIHCTKSILWESTVEMLFDGNTME